MNQANYHETIVIPTLQKKLQELQTSNLFLEVSLLVEQAKIKDIDAHYKNQFGNVESLKQDIDSKNQLIVTLKQQINNLNNEKNDLASKLARETSVKDSINIEYSKLKFEFDNLQLEFNNLKTSINTKKVKEPKLV